MHEQIQEQIKEALRAKDQIRLTTLRGVLSAFTNELKGASHKAQVLTDQEAGVIIKRLVKQRKDSIEQFEKGGRNDLAENEKAELKILEEFLPAQMDEEKVKEIVRLNIERLKIQDKSKIGILIGAVLKECAGQADGAVVKRIAEEMLG